MDGSLIRLCVASSCYSTSCIEFRHDECYNEHLRVFFTQSCSVLERDAHFSGLLAAFAQSTSAGPSHIAPWSRARFAMTRPRLEPNVQWRLQPESNRPERGRKKRRPRRPEPSAHWRHGLRTAPDLIGTAADKCAAYRSGPLTRTNLAWNRPQAYMRRMTMVFDIVERVRLSERFIGESRSALARL